MGLTVGIDLGTTNSAVAHLDEHGFPVIIPNGLGEQITPSVICFHGSDIIIGSEAKELQAAGEPEVASFFKRRMGDPNYIFHGNGRDHSATDLAALLLGKLKAEAEATLGEEVTDAVITVPAYFHIPEREATRAAGQMAGLNVLQLVNEPTAAAIAYGSRKMGDGRQILVYDLGGGTFDVAVCRIESEATRILTSTGDHELGGKDWDDRIIQFGASSFEREYGIDPFENAVSLADLVVEAEKIKRRLTTSQTAKISLVHGGNRGNYEVTRAWFEDDTRDLMQRTIDLTRYALGKFSLDASDIDDVLLVGGSTRMPMVHSYIREAFGKAPLQGVNVDEAVALGAVLEAAKYAPARRTFALRGVPNKVVDVTGHSLGMIAVNHDRSAYVNSFIIPKNQPIPCSHSRPYKFRTRQRGPNRVEIFVTQGEDESPADVTYIKKYVIADVPHTPGAESVLDFDYAFDASDTIQVTATVRGGAVLTVKTESLPEDLPGRFLGTPEDEMAPLHTTVYLAFDLSGSMSGEPLAEAKKAAQIFLTQMDLAHASVGIIAVADSVRTTLSACQDARAIESAVKCLEIGDVGYGNSAHPFDEAFGLLSVVDGRRFLVVLADGVWSDQPKAVRQARCLHSSEIEVIAIGFGGADGAFLKGIASCEEGSIFTTVDGLAEAFGSIAQVLTESSDCTMARSLLGRLRK